jgi:hypothetical protein
LSIFRLGGVFVLVYVSTLLAIRLLMALPGDPFLRYVVLALPMLAAGIAVVVWHGLSTAQHAPTAPQRRKQSA